jgi:non-specific serine/threonine protein kinase/serine/threonine-protein kinase
MALRKEPRRRYSSVEQFAEDIRRHLDGLPVIATKTSWSYRAGKFVTRHKAGVVATATVALALAIGIGLTVREARIARHQAEIARKEKARAEKRFNDVREFSDSLIFEVHDAIQNLPGATPARKLLLDRALEYLDSVSKDAVGDPDLQRELAWGYQRIAVVQGNATESNLGDEQAALASDRKALDLFESVAKANPTNTIDQLNVAMMHRILSYSTLTEASGHSDLQQAMVITEQLINKEPSNPKVRSERSIEYQNLALMRDAAGDRVGALEAYRKYREMRVELMRTNPEYRKIRRSVGMSTVMLGYALAREGSRSEGLKIVEEGIGFFETVPKGDDEINVKRELAIARQKRGDILLMNGDTEGALESYRQTRSALEPMAKADPQNTLLQFDVAGTDYHMGRALASANRYGDALASLQRARTTFEQLSALGRSADDSPRGPADIYIWLGDVVAAQGDSRSSLSYYQKAISALGNHPTATMDDDTRCTLATSYLKRGNILLQQGKLAEASSAYQTALQTTNPTAVDQKDVPALYVVAEVQTGLGSVATLKAHGAQSSEEHSLLMKEARSSFQRSRATWRQIPSPSRISPSGFFSRTLK